MSSLRKVSGKSSTSEPSLMRSTIPALRAGLAAHSQLTWSCASHAGSRTYFWLSWPQVTLIDPPFVTVSLHLDPYSIFIGPGLTNDFHYGAAPEHCQALAVGIWGHTQVDVVQLHMTWPARYYCGDRCGCRWYSRCW